MTEVKKNDVTSAPPPLPAVATVAGCLGLCAWNFPSLESIDNVATPELFTRRVFPSLLSLEGLILIRFAYFLVIATVTIQVACFTDGWQLRTSYLPSSKLRKSIITMSGIRTQMPYTSVTWNMLGLSFGLSSYIGLMVRMGYDVDPWILRVGLLVWETVAPNTLLVSAVVRYAIWPVAIRNGTSASCSHWRALVWHNANSAMTLLETALLGGMPVLSGHASLSILQGALYTIFAWLYMHKWTPDEKGRPHFIYFFFDTTLGKTTTMALQILIGVMIAFHFMFVVARYTMEYLGGGELLASLIFCTVVFSGVCRFRD
jgi:hypothetical protein